MKPADQNKTDEEFTAVMEKMRGDPLSVGTLEEFIDDNHAIVSGQHGPEYYATIMSFVDKDQLEPGSSILMNNKSHAVVGIM